MRGLADGFYNQKAPYQCVNHVSFIQNYITHTPSVHRTFAL